MRWPIRSKTSTSSLPISTGCEIRISRAKPAELLTDDDLKIIGTRYNRGPDLSLEKIKDSLSYGESIVNKKARLQELLKD